MSPWRFAASLLVLGLFISGSGCQQRDPRAPFLCCVLTCSEGLVTADKQIPENGDAGWRCPRGQPVGYDTSCSPEDTSECQAEDNPMQGTSDGGSGVGDAGARDAGIQDAGARDGQG